MAAKTYPPEVYKRQIQWLLFAATFIAFAYFHQGGGWNQNGRFAMVRAMVEERRFSIDSFLVYGGGAAKGGDLVRIPIRDCGFELGGQKFGISWTDSTGRLMPVKNTLECVVTGIDLGQRAIAIQFGKEATGAMPVSDSTEILKNGKAAKLSDIAVGDFAKVDFSWDVGGAMKTKRIEIRETGAQPDVMFVELGQIGATGDVAFDGGHFHPNKAPGTSFIAVPAYFVIYHLEKLFGANPDNWWTLTLNAWLTSVFSVGLLSAFGCVLFYRLALAWSGREIASLLSALTFAFGTMFFSYATMLYEHNIIAVGLVASFYLLYKVKAAATDRADAVEAADNPWLWLVLGGVCAGYAAITNYIVAVVVILLGVYVIWGVRRKLGWLWFGLGLMVPFLLICVYNVVCFGTPFTTNYRHQNPLFISGSKAFLGVFEWPQLGVLAAVLVSPFRGLFFSAPVLALGVFGLVQLFQDRKFRAEAWLLTSILGFFLVFIACFNGWHGGWAAGPRYLIPALPFLALTMVFGFVRHFKTSCLLAILSVAIAFVVTAVDPQSPIGNGGPGTVPGRPMAVERPFAASISYNPLTEYEFPIFFTGRPMPILESLVDGYLRDYDSKMTEHGVTLEQRRREMENMRRKMDASIANGEPSFFPLASFYGPVSVNPMGMYEGWFYRMFPAHSEPARANSFNVGEFVFPDSLASLLPLLLGSGVLCFIALRMARNVENTDRE